MFEGMYVLDARTGCCREHRFQPSALTSRTLRDDFRDTQEFLILQAVRGQVICSQDIRRRKGFWKQKQALVNAWAGNLFRAGAG